MENDGESAEVKTVVGTEIKVPESGTDDLSKKEEIKANLDKAISEAQETLRKTREETKKAKTGTEEGEILKIDDTDPGSQAWNKRINETVAPVASQIERQKDEVRTFALRRFLSDKPSLAKNPKKLKELMSNYDRIKTATEMTPEGIQLDLEKAYGATFHEELVSAARGSRIDQAKQDMILSDIAIDRGSTSETTPKIIKRQYSAEEQKIIDTWDTHGAPKID